MHEFHACGGVRTGDETAREAQRWSGLRPLGGQGSWDTWTVNERLNASVVHTRTAWVAIIEGTCHRGFLQRATGRTPECRWLVARGRSVTRAERMGRGRCGGREISMGALPRMGSGPRFGSKRQGDTRDQAWRAAWWRACSTKYIRLLSLPSAAVLA